MRTKRFAAQAANVFILIASLVTSASAATSIGGLSFSNTPLVLPEGGTQPAISIAANGAIAITGLQWLALGNSFGTRLWTVPPGSAPVFDGLLDANLQQGVKTVSDTEDADVDIGATGTLHATSLISLVTADANNTQLGISAITCPGATSSTFSIGNCRAQIIDTAGAHRPYITSDGPHVWISYHDKGNSILIQVQRSDDDGYTWKKVGNPIVGEGGATGDATFNNRLGPIVADPHTHNVYSMHAAGEPSVQKGTTADYNNIYVSRSTDMGRKWTTSLVFHAPLFTNLTTFFPSLAVDATNGKLYATWSDGRQLYFSTSSDQGSTWSAAVVVNTAPASTAIFPWVAAYGGTVSVGYYGTSAASIDDPAAVWNVYVAQTTDGGASFAQSLVSNTPNHVGAVCIRLVCAPGTGGLRLQFELAIDPQTGRTAVVYVDDRLMTDSSGKPLPQLVLAQQNP